MRLMFMTAFWIFLLDQVIKFYVLFNVFGLRWAQVTVPSDQLPYPQSVDVFPPFLTLRMSNSAKRPKLTPRFHAMRNV
ncbi:MAG: hypothetical protein AAFN63_17560, partial [Pseudomonadota bacterium]